jgi:broad specificity phosphatase PhoE
MRHAESVDDLTDQYGGWLDLPLTYKGKRQVEDATSKIIDLKIKFNGIYCSPLIRAKESAQIISNKLTLPISELLYFKEKNGYGLLTGFSKLEAKDKYPELLEALNGGYIYGSEPEDKFIERIKIGYQKLIDLNKDVLVITHGGVLSRLFEHILNYKYIKAYDGGFILYDTESKKIEKSDNFEFEVIK